MQEDLGFTFDTRKNGEVVIKREGKIVTKIGGKKAMRFIEDVSCGSFENQQQLMARVTGNYKRGNERKAKQHKRNN
ncbi:MAG: hypothetical protein MJE63_09380 [Proteobacteria bacterium]|nr:hypothetical protein [Pseudomonadota bacterium]